MGLDQRYFLLYLSLFTLSKYVATEKFKIAFVVYIISSGQSYLRIKYVCNLLLGA